MRTFQDIVRSFANETRLGWTMRHYLEPTIRRTLSIHPEKLRTPKSWDETISDAFVWRCDGGFKTRFDLMNLSSLIAPDSAADERVLLILFAQDGLEITRRVYDVEPFSTHTVHVDELRSRDDVEYGTFCVFHERQGKGVRWEVETCILERSYTSYKNRDECEVWSYVHGCCNSYVLSYDFKKDRASILSQKASEKECFRPQLRFDDCERFDVFFSNPLGSVEDLILKVYGVDGRLLDEIPHRLESLGCQMVTVDNSGMNKARIELEGHVYMGRPLLFKHYESHFDVLHS